VADCLEKALEAVPEEKRSANADLQTVFEGMELIDKVTYLIAQILCKSYASLTQVLRKSYASLTQVLRKSYASLTQVLRKSYACLVLLTCKVCWRTWSN
jgi:hypothetical protein